MSYRGPALQYRIRKTTVNNKTGDNQSITIPRFVAQQFSEVWFRVQVSGECIILQSGCKITIDDLPPQHDESKKIYIEGRPVVFR